MTNNIKDVSTAIDTLIRFIRLYDKVVAQDFSLLLNPITRGDIDGGLMVLKRRLCQATENDATENDATDHEATDHNATDHEATDHNATDHEATDHEATDHEATDHEATDHEATDHEATDHEATDHEAIDHEAIDHEATDHEATDHEETEIQKILRDPDAKLIFESFRQDFERSATDFIAIYGANPEHFWNKLPLLNDGHIVSQLLKLLNNHSQLSDLTQRLLEIKLYEQVQLLERAFIESNGTLRKGETTRSVALQRVLCHKASRAEDYKVDRGKKLSVFELIDLFRISKPHWRKWREIELAKVQMICKNLRPVEAAWAKDLSDVLSKVYKRIPSQTTREGEAQTRDSEVENPNLPVSSFLTSESPVDSHADYLESRNGEATDSELNSSSAEAIASNKRSASGLCPPAAKRQRLGKVAPPSRGPTAESDPLNDGTVHPSNDNSAQRGMLNVGSSRDFGAQSNSAIDYQAFGCSLSDNSAPLDFNSRNQQRDPLGRVSTGTALPHDETAPQEQIQLAQTRSHQPTLAPVVGDSMCADDYSIGPDPIDAVIASAEPRVPWPTGMDSYDADRDPIDAIIASAEPRVPWPTGMDSYDADRDPIDAIIASAEPRVPWPTGMDSYDADRDPIDAIIASAEARVPWPTIDDIVSVEGGAYQWPLPNQHPIAAT